MDYESALKFYYDAGKFCHAPGLDSMFKLCRALGDPQKKLRFIHIAGTNGKGSCAAMLTSVLRCAGYKVGRYTSPDLVDFSERISVNEVDIKKDDIARLTPQIMNASASLPPLSFFELVTALGFLYFAEQQCDIVVSECGLGGLYDATNIAENKDISIIMPIGFDHCNLLGNTLSAIAAEKAGIIRPGVPVVCTPQEAEALSVIQERCRTLSAPLNLVDITFLSTTSGSLKGQSFFYKSNTEFFIPLLGTHQLANAAAVIEAARILDLDDSVIAQGLARAQWPCRFELVRENPPFIIDGAHNPHGAAALSASLSKYFPGQKLCFIIGVMADKDVAGILDCIKPLAAKFCCVAPPSERSLSAEALARLTAPIPAMPCDSLDKALEIAEDSALPCCACGSLYFVGQLRQMLKCRNK